MNIMSIQFFIFVFFSLFVYYIIPKKMQWVCLLVVSVIFFVFSSGISMLPYIIFGIFTAFLGAKLIENCKDDKKRKLILIVTLVLIIGELFIFKYINFIPTTLNKIFAFANSDFKLDTYNFLAPLGISYYTLSITGYVLDVYWKSYKHQPNFFKLALFGCYFPHMISGPVVKYEPLSQQFFSGVKFSFIEIKFGLMRIGYGLLKKLLIADILKPIIDKHYNNFSNIPGSYIVISTILYAFYLYADFSGCMDIVLGVSRMFGIKLPENFNQPFFSTTLGEFWRRWHISLGLWFKDYLLYPLLKSDSMQNIKSKIKNKWGKKLSKTIPTYLGLCVLWLTIGFWHNGDWKFILASGVVPGIYLILGDILSPYLAKLTALLKINTTCFSFKFLQQIRTFTLMCIVFCLSNANNIKHAFQLLYHSIFSFDPLSLLTLNKFGFTKDFNFTFIALLVVFVVSSLSEKGIDVYKKLSEQNIVFRWTIYLLNIFVILWFLGKSAGSVGGFMYAQF